MNMTESEAKYYLLECSPITGFKTHNEALDVAIKALDEIQQYKAIGTVEEFKKSVKEEDVLKFYYIESEDKYVVGQRIDTRYYAEVGKTGLCFYMSRYLPWGEDGFSSEPKEIPFFDWLQGFVKKEYGGTVEEFKVLKENERNCKDCAGCTNWKCDCANVRAMVIDEFVEKIMEYCSMSEMNRKMINQIAEQMKAGGNHE